MRVGDLGERALIDRVREIAVRYSVTPIPRDDAAILAVDGGAKVVATTDRVPGDLLARRAGLMTAEELGRYVVEVNVSDLVAMGAAPLGFLLNIGLPNDFELGEFESLIDGVARRAAEVGAPLIGGDTKTAAGLQVVGVALGQIPPGCEAVRRDSARSGDELRVSGPLGGFGAALAYFFRGDTSRELPSTVVSRLRERLVHPTARIDLLAEVRQFCTACMDITDGLAESVLELERASGCAFQIDASLIPLDPLAREVAAFLDIDPIDIILGIGLDLELLHCSRDAHMSGSTAIGVTITGAVGGSTLRRDGAEVRLAESRGFEHLQRDAASYVAR